jgi:hypothetical protein
MKLSRLSALAILLVTASLTACSQDTACTAVGYPSLVIIVSGAKPGVCSATVQITYGKTALKPAGHSGQPSTCTYFGPVERAGTFVVRVRDGSVVRTIANIRVVKGGVCHQVRTRTVDVRLALQHP